MRHETEHERSTHGQISCVVILIVKGCPGLVPKVRGLEEQIVGGGELYELMPGEDVVEAKTKEDRKGTQPQRVEGSEVARFPEIHQDEEDHHQVRAHEDDALHALRRLGCPRDRECSDKPPEHEKLDLPPNTQAGQPESPVIQTKGDEDREHRDDKHEPVRKDVDHTADAHGECP